MTKHFALYKKEMKKLNKMNAFLNASNRNRNIMMGVAMRHLNNHRKEMNTKNTLNS